MFNLYSQRAHHDIISSMSYKCHLCPICNGNACSSELPGMGGVFEGKNFKANCSAWKELYENLSLKQLEAVYQKLSPQIIRLGPMTGAVENMGWPHEESTFYEPFLRKVHESKALLSIGDGCPDDKLQSGIAALEKIGTKGAVFFKPYPDHKLYERLEWAAGCADLFGIDIDAYNIVTMRNKVNLEIKSVSSLNALRKAGKKPFALKGIFTQADLELVKAFRPDIAVISNHGGRVETDKGSSAQFLKEHFSEIKDYCGQVWVDGGLRTKQDVLTALALGADEVMLGRPFVTAFFRDQENGINEMIKGIVE